MSLKHFHLVFITIAALLFVGVAVWAFEFSRESALANGLMGWGSSLVAFALIVYGVYFFRKSRHIIT